MTSMWDYDSSTTGRYADGDVDVIGYDVHASDGRIGSVDEASDRAGAAYLVVDTGFWIFGKKRMIPAGVVDRVDADAREVHVHMTKDQIKAAPDFEDRDRDERDRHDTYYGSLPR